MALELGYLKGGYVNFWFCCSGFVLQDHCNLLYIPLSGGHSHLNSFQLHVDTVNSLIRCVINVYILFRNITLTIFQNIFAISVMVGLRVFLNRPLESSFKKLHFGGKKRF